MSQPWGAGFLHPWRLAPHHSTAVPPSDRNHLAQAVLGLKVSAVAVELGEALQQPRVAGGLQQQLAKPAGGLIASPLAGMQVSAMGIGR